MQDSFCQKFREAQRNYNTILKILSKYWLQTQKNINIIKGQSIFLKTHHACISYMNNPFTTPEISDGVIYIVRDPRDVII